MRLISYNTHLFYGTAVPVQYRDKARLDDMIVRLARSDADIVGLCEVWSDHVKKQIINDLRPYFQDSYFHATAGTEMGSGLLLLSRYRLSKTAFTKYTNLVGADALSQKGFYTAVASVPKPEGIVPVFLVLTHTQADSSPSDVDARNKNLWQLASGIQHLPFRGRSMYVMGDFNVCGEIDGIPTPAYNELKKLLAPYGLQDLCQLIYPSAFEHPLYTYSYYTNSLARYFAPGDKVKQRLDYVFAREVGTASTIGFAVPDDWKFTNTSPDDTSDHYPIVVTTP
ncbi:MAG TPA: endonuclease/exonuclease/phosphatase family protein [Nitrospira sp.]|nr:endonuclease/exonuclease/phosphatase family protein [Nitrospira sp.]